MDVSPIDSGARLSSDTTATSNNSVSQPLSSSSTVNATASHLIDVLGLEHKERDPVVYHIENPLNLNKSLLRDPLTSKHKNEYDFNKSLFAKSREMVAEALKRLGYPKPLQNDDSQLVCSFKVEDNVHDVFFGLSREATDTKTNLKPDHAVVLFRKKAIKDENTQKIVDFYEVFRFLAVVELKFLNKDHSPAELTRDIDDNSIDEPLLRIKHHCLAQAISYIFRLVWPGLCGCGYSGTEVPFAVIVGKKEGIDINPHLRCAHGSVVMSQECCGGPEYHIDDSISFLLEKKKKGPEEQPPKKTKIEIKQEEVTVDLIAGVYSDIVSFGMNVALKVPQTRIDNPMGYPLSGRKLTINGEDLYPEGPLTLIASPVSSRGGHGLKVAQGDLFEGFLSEELLKKLTVDGVDGVWFRKPPEGGCKVIVKVSSVIHQPTVERKSVLLVLQNVMYRGSDSLKGSLAEVLLVVKKQGFGMITVMRDLRGDDEYQVLRPKALISSGYPFVTMWGGVENLVDSVLLPITQEPMNAVHCDIRPGYDHTSNILVKEDWGNLKLVLIDHESFAEYPADVPKFLNSDGRYVHSAYAANAVEYLWWQCVLLAYVWSGRLNEYVPEEVNKKAASQIIKDCLGLGETGAVATNKFEEWLLKNETMLDHLRLRQKRADPKELHNMLKAISGFFEEYH